MALDPRYWTILEAHGVTNDHLRMLARVFETQENFTITWHGLNGVLRRCEMNVAFIAKAFQVNRVCDGVLTDTHLP